MYSKQILLKRAIIPYQMQNSVEKYKGEWRGKSLKMYVYAFYSHTEQGVGS